MQLTCDEYAELKITFNKIWLKVRICSWWADLYTLANCKQNYIQQGKVILVVNKVVWMNMLSILPLATSEIKSYGKV